MAYKEIPELYLVSWKLLTNIGAGQVIREVYLEYLALKSLALLCRYIGTAGIAVMTYRIFILEQILTWSEILGPISMLCAGLGVPFFAWQKIDHVRKLIGRPPTRNGRSS